MWVLPENYQPSWRSALDMVASKEDLSSPVLNIESSLMWRSKPSLLRTWLTRWKRVSWLQHLSGRILKPSRWGYFEERLTSSLEATRVSRFRQRGVEPDQTTLDTYGPTCQRLYGAYNPDEYSSRMLTVTSASGLTKSSQTWKDAVTKRRGAYSQRLKSARLTREKECISWRTPAVADPGITVGRLQTADGGAPVSGERLYDKETGRNCQYGLTQEAQWATPNTKDTIGSRSLESLRRAKLKGGCCNLKDQIAHPGEYPKTWATPNTMDYMGQRSPEAMKKMIRNGQRKNRTRPSNLREQVNPEMVQAVNEARADANGVPVSQLRPPAWPTISARDYKDSPGMAKQATNPDGSARKRVDQLARRVYDVENTPPAAGHLSPDWVEWLMGVPAGWTDLYAYPGAVAPFHTEPPIPRVTESNVDRVDRIRMLGNGVVPQTAAKAWEVLNDELR